MLLLCFMCLVYLTGGTQGLTSFCYRSALKLLFFSFKVSNSLHVVFLPDFVSVVQLCCTSGLTICWDLFWRCGLVNQVINAAVLAFPGLIALKLSDFYLFYPGFFTFIFSGNNLEMTTLWHSCFFLVTLLLQCYYRAVFPYYYPRFWRAYYPITVISW